MRFGIALLAVQAALPCLCLALPTGSPEFIVQTPRGDGTPIIRAADYGFSETNDFNAAAINRALAACRERGARTLELDPGTYRCFDAPHGIAVTNFTDLTLDGRGALLVFRRPAEFRCQPQSELVHENANLLVKDCERVKVCDRSASSASARRFTSMRRALMHPTLTLCSRTSPATRNIQSRFRSRRYRLWILRMSASRPDRTGTLGCRRGIGARRTNGSPRICCAYIRRSRI